MTLFLYLVIRPRDFERAERARDKQGREWKGGKKREGKGGKKRKKKG